MRYKHANLYNTADELGLRLQQLIGYSRLGVLDRMRDWDEDPLPLSQPTSDLGERRLMRTDLEQHQSYLGGQRQVHPTCLYQRLNNCDAYVRILRHRITPVPLFGFDQDVVHRQPARRLYRSYTVTSICLD